MELTSNKKKIYALTVSEMKNVSGGVLPLAVIGFAKGFAWGVGAAGTAITALRAAEKLAYNITS